MRLLDFQQVVYVVGAVCCVLLDFVSLIGYLFGVGYVCCYVLLVVVFVNVWWGLVVCLCLDIW